MEIIIKAQISDNDKDECGGGCPFLEDNTCLLFSKELEDIILPEGHVWNDCAPTKQRCSNCLYLTFK